MTANLETFKTEAEWLEARKKAITSTDAAVIAGVGYISPLELWMQKTGRLEQAPDSRRFRFGRWAESYIAEELERETGHKLVALPPHSLMRSGDNPARIASLDREVVPSGLAEFKTVSHRLVDRWKDGPADYAFVQVQHALYVTGYDRAWIACLVGAGEDFLTFEVAPSPQFIEELLEREAAFEKCVQTDTPPLASGTEADKDALAKLYPKDTGETVILDANKFAPIVQQYRESKHGAKEYEEQAAAAESYIKEAMKDAAYAEIPGVGRFSWKKQVREMKPQPARTIETRVFREVKI